MGRNGRHCAHDHETYLQLPRMHHCHDSHDIPAATVTNSAANMSDLDMWHVVPVSKLCVL